MDTKLSAKTTRKIINYVKANPQITSRIADSFGSIWKKCACIYTSGHVSTFQGCWKESSDLTQRSVLPILIFFKKHKDKPEVFWKAILLTDKFKIEWFNQNGNHHFWRKTNTAYKEKELFPTVKHGGGNIKVWGCFSTWTWTSRNLSREPWIRWNFKKKKNLHHNLSQREVGGTSELWERAKIPKQMWVTD